MQVVNAVWRGQVTAFIDGEGPYFRPYNKMEQFNLELADNENAEATRIDLSQGVGNTGVQSF